LPLLLPPGEELCTGYEPVGGHHSMEHSHLPFPATLTTLLFLPYSPWPSSKLQLRRGKLITTGVSSCKVAHIHQLRRAAEVGVKVVWGIVEDEQQPANRRQPQKPHQLHQLEH